MKKFVKTLRIDCDGLSQKSIAELADELTMYFCEVDVHGDTIHASEPASQNLYEQARLIFDRLELNVT